MLCIIENNNKTKLFCALRRRGWKMRINSVYNSLIITQSMHKVAIQDHIYIYENIRTWVKRRSSTKTKEADEQQNSSLIIHPQFLVYILLFIAFASSFFAIADTYIKLLWIDIIMKGILCKMTWSQSEQSTKKNQMYRCCIIAQSFIEFLSLSLVPIFFFLLIFSCRLFSITVHGEWDME